MEESSNGKLEEIQKVESQDKEVVIEESGEFKTEAESVREISVNGNSESVKENGDGDDSSSHSSSSDEEAEPNEKSPQVMDSGELEEEKIVVDSVVDQVEAEVPLSEALTEDAEVPVKIPEASVDVAESESKEIEGKLLQSLEEKMLPLEETNGISADETIVVSESIEEETLPSSDEINGVSPVVTDVVSKGIEEMTLPSSKEKGQAETTLPSYEEKGKGIEDITLPSFENGEVPEAVTDVVLKSIEETKLPALEKNTEESSGTADLESKAKVDETTQGMSNAGTVDATNGRDQTNEAETIPGSIGNPPIISLNQRNFRPTSWRSCCGLLEVLRRSDR